MVCQCLENPGLKPTIAQNSIMNMLPKSPVNHLHEEIHIKEEHLIKDEFESSTESSNFSTHLESSTIKDLFCEQCKLQFDKKIVYDIHLKIVHKKDTIVPIETRCKPVNDTSTDHEEHSQHKCILCLSFSSTNSGIIAILCVILLGGKFFYG